MTEPQRDRRPLRFNKGCGSPPFCFVLILCMRREQAPALRFITICGSPPCCLFSPFVFRRATTGRPYKNNKTLSLLVGAVVCPRIVYSFVYSPSRKKHRPLAFLRFGRCFLLLLFRSQITAYSVYSRRGACILLTLILFPLSRSRLLLLLYRQAHR